MCAEASVHNHIELWHTILVCVTCVILEMDSKFSFASRKGAGYFFRHPEAWKYKFDAGI